MEQLLMPDDSDQIAQLFTRLISDQKGDQYKILVSRFQPILKERCTTLQKQFEQREIDGTLYVRTYSDLIDCLIKGLAIFTIDTVYPEARSSSLEIFDLTATGGYGRREMAPYSDIDLLFLLPRKKTYLVEQIAEFILSMLWDFGFKVGHSVCSVEECSQLAKTDLTVKTTLLDIRFLWGSGQLFDRLYHHYQRDIISCHATTFLKGKLKERDERYRRTALSRYLLEPNIKECKGGLRDLQTLLWIGKVLYQGSSITDLGAKGILHPKEVRRFTKAQNFLWTLRCHLHFLAGRADDHLHFESQIDVSHRMGYANRPGVSAVERFMKHYYLIARDVGTLTHIFCTILETESRSHFSVLWRSVRKKPIDGFLLEDQYLCVSQEHQFHDHPIDIIRLFYVGQKHGLSIHPKTLRLLGRSVYACKKLCSDPEANRFFLEILTSPYNPEATLRQMREARIFRSFLPPFAQIIGQIQYDPYHCYTVDEHTLRALGILYQIENQQMTNELPKASREIHFVVFRRALYVALFLHDIAKGQKGDHSILGSHLAFELCRRFGLSQQESDLVAWLIRHHLVMSLTAFRHDLDDVQTIQNFVTLVQSPERLRLLLILTTADINAVGPDRWNAHNAYLIEGLYDRALDMMSGSFDAKREEGRDQIAKRAFMDEMTDWTQEKCAWFFSIIDPSYWLSFTSESHAYYARLIDEAETQRIPLFIKDRLHPAPTITEMVIYTQDRLKLFALLTGALALAGATIINARILTFRNKMAFDVFWIKDAVVGGPFDDRKKRARLSVLIQQTLDGTLCLKRELLQRREPIGQVRHRMIFKVAPQIHIDTDLSMTDTVIEIKANDHIGLLYDITRTLTRCNLQIMSAKIATFGTKVVDVFYVRDREGMKVTHPDRLKKIEQMLLHVLTDPHGEEIPLTGKADH